MTGAPAPLSAATIEARLGAMIPEILDEPFTGEDPLAAGAVDSLGIEQLLELLEEELGVVLDDEEVVEANFESLPALAALVASKLGPEHSA